MKKHEAKIILENIGTAATTDTKCYSCAKKIFQDFVDEFPKFRSVAEEVYYKYFAEGLF